MNKLLLNIVVFISLLFFSSCYIILSDPFAVVEEAYDEHPDPRPIPAPSPKPHPTPNPIIDNGEKLVIIQKK